MTRYDLSFELVVHEFVIMPNVAVDKSSAEIFVALLVYRVPFYMKISIHKSSAFRLCQSALAN